MPDISQPLCGPLFEMGPGHLVGVRPPEVLSLGHRDVRDAWAQPLESSAHDPVYLFYRESLRKAAGSYSSDFTVRG